MTATPSMPAALKIKSRGTTKPLTGEAMNDALVDYYTKLVLTFSLKYKRARNKFKRMEYKSAVSQLNAKLAEIQSNAHLHDTIKLDN